MVKGGVGAAVISEIMIDPVESTDKDGEWIEFYNPSSELELDINGWIVRVVGEEGTSSHVIDNGGPLLVAQEDYVVLARSDVRWLNGALEFDYLIDGGEFDNKDGTIELIDGDGSSVDVVVYTSTWAFRGAAVSLNPLFFDASSNDTRSNWCRATSKYGAGDKGTPGLENDQC